MKLLSLAVRTRLELATPCVTGRYSNQLNYRTKRTFPLKRRAKVTKSGFHASRNFNILKFICFFELTPCEVSD